MWTKRFFLIGGSLALLAVLAFAWSGRSEASETALPSLGDSSGATVGEKLDPEEARQAFAQCMRDNGADMPDPLAGDEGMTLSLGSGDFEAFAQAAEQCRHFLDDVFGQFEMTPEQEAELLDRQLEFAQCMRDNGIDWPDPTPGEPVPFDYGSAGPDVLAAMESCAPEGSNSTASSIGGFSPGGVSP